MPSLLVLPPGAVWVDHSVFTSLLGSLTEAVVLSWRLIGWDQTLEGMFSLELVSSHASHDSGGCQTSVDRQP